MQKSTPGRRTFIAGAVGLILAGSSHSLAVLAVVFGEPQSEAEVAYRQAAEAFVLTTEPFESNAWGGNQILSASYSVLLVQTGLLSLWAMGPLQQAGLLRRLTLLNLICSGLQLGISIAYQFIPPMAFCGVVFVLFAVSLWRQRGAASAATLT